MMSSGSSVVVVVVVDTWLEYLHYGHSHSSYRYGTCLSVVPLWYLTYLVLPDGFTNVGSTNVDLLY